MENDKKDPILVVNPYNGKYINVRPLFDFLNEYAMDEPQEVASRLMNDIRFYMMSCDNSGIEVMDLKNSLFMQYNLYDMFEALSAFKEVKK